MKKYWAMIVLGIIAAVLAGVYFMLVRNTDVSSDTQLYRFSPDEELQEMTVTNSFGKFTFKKEGENWIMVEPGHYRVNQEKAKVMEEFLLELPINRTLDAELTEYGFSQPGATVEFVTQANDKNSFQIGNQTASKAQVYLKDLDSNRILIADIGSVAQFDGSLAAYRDKELFSIDKDDISKITYYKNGEKQVAVEKNSPQDWRMTYPYEAPARHIELNEQIVAMRNWSIAGYPEQAELDVQAMGLDKPAHVLELTDSKGNTQRLEFGSNANGTIFVRTGGDQDIVKQFSVDVNFDKLAAERLLFFAPLRTTIKEVQKIDIAFDNRKETFEIDGSVEPPAITSGGKEIPYMDFVTFFVKYLSLSADGYDPAGNAGSPVMLLTTTFKDGSTKTLKLLNRDENSLFMDDGGEVRFFMNSEKLEQLIYHLEAALAAQK